MQSNLDVLFVHPNAASKIYQGLSTEYSAKEPPIWASLLANGVRAKGYSVGILDCEANNYQSEDTVFQIRALNPRLVVLVIYGQQPSASTQNMVGAKKLLDVLEAYYSTRYKVMLIGGHISALPQNSLDTICSDYVVKGEGLDSILDFLNNKGPIDHIYTESIIPQEELGTKLPGMAWDLLPMDKYRTSNWHGWTNKGIRTPFASVYTSLGCPFSCTFCMINSPFSKKMIRYWDPKHTIKEFDRIAEMGIKNVKIADEMFVLVEDHFLELCKLIAERKHDFNIWCYSRIDTVKERHLEILKKAGVNWLALGIESGVKEVRKDVVKGKYEDVNILNIVKKIREFDICVGANYIFGLPEDNQETMQRTLDLALELKTEYANFYCAMAYPGSKLYEIAIKEGWKLPETWLGYSQHAYETRPLDTKYITGGEVLTFRDRAFKQYFSNPSYLSYMKDKFGQYVIDDINNMMKIDLKRKYAI
jgi:radical SAM superfamily enzyme YgiQ (UPF0313 family)